MKKGGKNFPEGSRKEYIRLKDGLSETLRWRDREGGHEVGQVTESPVYLLAGPFKDSDLILKVMGSHWRILSRKA